MTDRKYYLPELNWFSRFIITTVIMMVEAFYAPKSNTIIYYEQSMARRKVR